MTLSDPMQMAQQPAQQSGMSALLDGVEPAPAQHWFDRLPQVSSDFVQGLHTRENPADRRAGADRCDGENSQIQQAFQQGVKAGREAAEEEARLKEHATRELRLRFGELDSVALESMENALGATVLNLCDQLFEDFTIDADLLAHRCRKAATKLGDAAKGCALHLNPADAALLAADTASEWRIVEDEMLERGSLLFESVDGSVSDGPAEWREAIAEAIGHLGAADTSSPV